MCGSLRPMHTHIIIHKRSGMGKGKRGFHVFPPFEIGSTSQVKLYLRSAVSVLLSF